MTIENLNGDVQRIADLLALSGVEDADFDPLPSRDPAQAADLG